MRWVKILIFVICMFVYAGLGGVVFHFVESNHESQQRETAIPNVKAFLQNHPCLNLSDVRSFGKEWSRLREGGLLFNSSSGALINATNWDIMSSIFLASQVVGSVGYGSVTPRTVGGRIFTVFYTIFGLPLFVIVALGLGFLIGKPIANFIQRVELRLYGDPKEIVEPVQNSVTPVTTAKKGWRSSLRSIWIYFLRVATLFVIGVIFLVIIPAAIFLALETWTYGESVYYCFVSVLSIGFGDFVPGDQYYQVNYQSIYRLCVGLWVNLSIIYFIIVFSPISDALNFREEIQKPLDLHEGRRTQDVVYAPHLNQRPMSYENPPATQNFVTEDFTDREPGNQYQQPNDGQLLGGPGNQYQQHNDGQLLGGTQYVNNGFSDYGPTQLYPSLADEMTPPHHVSHGIITRVNVP